MKKKKLLLPLMAFVLAIGSAFASIILADQPANYRYMDLTCYVCKVDEDCSPINTGQRCQCHENGYDAWDLGTSCVVPIYKP